MARRKRSIRPPTAPPPTPSGGAQASSQKRKPPGQAGAHVEQAPRASQATAAGLDQQYGHVRRDLTRIVVLAVLMFGLIFASKLLPLS